MWILVMKNGVVPVDSGYVTRFITGFMSNFAAHFSSELRVSEITDKGQVVGCQIMKTGLV